MWINLIYKTSIFVFSLSLIFSFMLARRSQQLSSLHSEPNQPDLIKWCMNNKPMSTQFLPFMCHLTPSPISHEILGASVVEKKMSVTQYIKRQSLYLQVGVVDALNKCRTFTQETGLCVPRETENFFFFSFVMQ